MKHALILLSYACCLTPLTSFAALPEKWDVELAAQPPQVFTLQRPRGETYELEAVLKNHGKPFAPAITNAFIYWQTNGMENLYWSAPASVSNNVLRASWLPSMDPGATTVRGYIGDPGHIYAAAFQFRFIASPGETPNELPLPQKVIDFAKVTVLNPPWSGGGGSVDTNAVRDIARETVSGDARLLPKYLHALDFADTYPEDAAWYYAQPQPYTSCSAVRDGNTLSRNYDWTFDSAAEFVLSVSGNADRFASVGVANVGTNLTEQMVTSGKWSRYYKCLPGHTVDGINEHGVVAEINVVDGDPSWHGGLLPSLHPLAAVRWALDHATNAQHAAEYLASHIAFPDGWTQNFHYMIADAEATYIVENGSAHDVTDGVKVMTNFRLFPSRDTTGPGQERYDLLLSSACCITNAWYTRAYSPETSWLSDFNGSETLMATSKVLWASKPREQHRGEIFHSTTTTSDYDYTWWQTVHTSVYDITNRVLRVAVQEIDDWYTFQVPTTGGGTDEAKVREIANETIAASPIVAGKADKSTTYTKTETLALWSDLNWQLSAKTWLTSGASLWNDPSWQLSADAWLSLKNLAPRSMISRNDTTFSNEVAAVAATVSPPPFPYLRVWDEVLQCWWIGRMVNGVMQWEVE